jgi:hypothetical protein
MTCEYIGKQRSSGENSAIVTGGLEIELTGASALLHDVALERHPTPPPIEGLTSAHEGVKYQDSLNQVGRDGVAKLLCHCVW